MSTTQANAMAILLCLLAIFAAEWAEHAATPASCTGAAR
ncbi:MAG: hypothetical protein JWQ72_1608 [Polaromonas sp.]|nr:hypothetical protein [Polaromonas sp.]